MAVTVEGTPTVSAEGVATPLQFNHTVGATATGLFVGIAVETNLQITAVTFNGDALTSIFETATGLDVARIEGWLMVNPDIGTFQVSITYAGTPGSGTAAVAVGLAGLETSSVAAAYRSGTAYTNLGDGVAGGPTVTVVNSQAGDLVIDCAAVYAGTGIAVGTNQTSRGSVDTMAGGGISFGVSTESAAGANTVMTWTPVGGTGDYWGCGAAALVAASVGGADLTLVLVEPSITVTTF